MAGIVSFFVIVILSLVVVRIATVLLLLSGLSEDAAKFQARSAFTGTGYTTREAENVVGHPFRRRVVMFLMLLRNFGFVSVISTLIISFLGTETNVQVLLRIGIIVGGLLLVYAVSRSRLLDRGLRRVVLRALRNSTVVRVADYENLLNLSGEYEVIESPVHDDSWLAGRSLAELELGAEGVLMLGIRRADGYFVGAPTGSSRVVAGDHVIMYGRDTALREVSERTAGKGGDEQHLEAVRRQREWGKGPLERDRGEEGEKPTVRRRLRRFFRRRR